MTYFGVQRLLQDFALRLKDPERYSQLLIVARGGLPIGCILSHLLDIRSIGIVTVQSYTDKRTQLQDVKLSSTADPRKFNSPNTLIVDDICDTGRTMNILSVVYPLAKRYCLIVKPLGEGAIHAASQKVNQDLWVEFPWEIKKGALIDNTPDVSESSQ